MLDYPDLVDQDAINETQFAQRLIEIELGLRDWPEPDAKRHHFVPRFFLDRFAEQGWLTQLDKRSGQPQKVRADKAASKTRFYRFSNDEGEVSNVIEGVFGMAEDDAAPALLRLEETGDLTDHDRASVATFLAYQWSRTPTARRRGERAGEDIRLGGLAHEIGNAGAFQEKIRQATESGVGDLPTTPDAIEDLRQTMIGQLRAGQVTSKDPDGGFTTGLLIQAAHDIASEMFLAMEWTLLRSPADSPFITSDVGIVVVDPSPAHPWSPPTPLSSPDAQTFVPISSNYCLVLTSGGPTLEIVDATKSRVDEINLRIYGWADRFIYGKSQSIVSRVRRLLKTPKCKHAESSPEARFVTLIPQDPADDRLARAHMDRGWPPYLMAEENGSLVPFDYLVTGEDGSAVEVAFDANSLLEERERRRLGLGPDDPLEGGPALAHVPTPDVVPTRIVDGIMRSGK